jgi:hypothetical protein
MKQKNWKLRIGIALIIGCIPFYLVLPIIPFLGIDNKLKIFLSTLSIILGEVSFWAGGFLVGKELFAKYKTYFNPRNWFRRNLKDDE